MRQKNIPFASEAVGPTEWGYRGYHITFRNANGIGAEIQLSRPDVWTVKLESDKIHKKWRNMTDCSALSNAEYIQYMNDVQRSKKMWSQLNLPDFKNWESSASDSTRALKWSSADTGRTGFTHDPLTSSRTRTLGSLENSSMRPDSVKQAIDSPLSDSSISQIFRNVNTVDDISINPPEGMQARRVAERIVEDVTQPLELRKGQLLPMLDLNSDEWYADETVVKISGVKHYLWFVVDSETRFVIGYHLSPHRDSPQAVSVLHEAHETGQTPSHCLRPLQRLQGVGEVAV